MSISNFLIQGDDVAPDWVNLRVNSIQIDSELILSESAQNVLSLDIIPFSINGTTQDLNSNKLVNSNSSNISPIGITYNGIFINVPITGYYLFTINLQFNLNTYSTPEKLNIILWNDTSGFGIVDNDIYIDNGNIFNGGFSRVVNLLENVDYKILLNQVNAVILDIAGNQKSFISIIKLF